MKKPNLTAITITGSRMLFQRFALLVLLFAMVFFLSACRQKCVPGADIYPDCRGGLPPEEHELVVWNIGEDEDVFADQFASFSKKYKTVSISYKSFPDEAEYKKALLKAIAVGNGPDIFAMPYEWLAENRALVAPAPAAKVDPIVFRDLFHPAIGEILIEKSGETEEVFGVALALETLGLYYNLDALRQEVNKFSPAKTWDELIQDAALLAKRDPQTGELIRSGVALGLGNSIRSAPDVLSLLLVQYGAKVFDAEMKSSILAEKQTATASQSTSAPASKALELYSSFGDKNNTHFSWSTTLAEDQTAELGAFLRGDIAMIFGYPELMQKLIDLKKELSKEKLIDIDKTVRIAPAPQLVSDNKYQWDDSANIARFNAFFVSKQSTHAESAWELLLHLADEESADLYQKATGKAPARKSLTEKILNDDSAKREIKIFAEQAKRARPLVVGDSADFAVIMRNVADAIAQDGVSTGTALNRAQKQLQCVLERIKGDATKIKCTEVQD